jgi:hypothetical protein
MLVFMTNNPHYSFCNQTEHETGPLLAKLNADSRHARETRAEMAIDEIDREVLRRATERPRFARN